MGKGSYFHKNPYDREACAREIGNLMERMGDDSRAAFGHERSVSEDINAELNYLKRMLEEYGGRFLDIPQENLERFVTGFIQSLKDGEFERAERFAEKLREEKDPMLGEVLVQETPALAKR